MHDSFTFQGILRTVPSGWYEVMCLVQSLFFFIKLNTLAVIFQSSIELSLALVYCVGSHTQYKPFSDVHSYT